MKQTTFWLILFLGLGWGFGYFSKVVVTFNHVGGSFNLFKYHHRGCLNSPVFSNFGSCAACWACFMCHHELWPTSVSHRFSSLNSSLGLAGGKHYQKITIPIFRLVKLIVTSRLWVIYVREDNYSNVQARITQLIWTAWTLLSAARERPLNLNHSLLFWSIGFWQVYG